MLEFAWNKWKIKNFHQCEESCKMNQIEIVELTNTPKNFFKLWIVDLLCYVQDPAPKNRSKATSINYVWLLICQLCPSKIGGGIQILIIQYIFSCWNGIKEEIDDRSRKIFKHKLISIYLDQRESFKARL